MSRRRTSVLKILCDAPENRRISEFPLPFKKNSTPYITEKFDLSVENACNSEDSVTTSDLKICKVIILGDVATGKTCLVNRSNTK